jgi:protein TonB
MGLVAAIHVAVLLAIMRSMGIGTKVDLPKPMISEIFPDKPVVDDPPPLPNPDLRPSDSRVAPPELTDVAFEQDVISPPDEIVIGGPTEVVQPPVRVEVVGVRQDPRSPLSKPPYSARMIREGNQGTIEIEVYVLPNGRVGDARVVKSTGFEELDLAAMAEAKRHWRLLPATRDGVPFEQWYRLRVSFRLDGSN